MKRSVLEDIISQGISVNNTRETEWVLNIPLPAPEPSSEELGEASDENEHNGWTETNGRQSYGSFKRKKRTNGDDKRNDASAHGSHNRYGLNLLDDMDSEGEVGEAGSSDEENSDADASKAPRQEKRRAPAMDYSDERALAALDAVDLSRSSYAKSKGAFVQYGRAGSGGRFGNQGQTSGKFRNGDKVHKKTKHKRM